jgi:hypothetical protein
MRLLPILAVVFMVGLVLPIFLTPGNAEYTTPIVWSNKKEYDPSETAHLYGYGFKILSQVNITIIRPDSVEDKVQTSTDEFGYFACQYLLDGIHGTFMVTVTDGVNLATTTFDNALYLNAWWSNGDSTYIYAEASGLSPSKRYYIKYFDPAGVERRKSPTYTGVSYIADNLTILPSFPNILGYWVVRLYENDVLKKSKTLYIDIIVWTTDSTYTNLVTSFAQGETVYFKTIGLQTSKYYRFKLEMPNGTRFFVGSWTTGVTSMTGSYVLPSNAPLGSWKLHVRQATDSSGSCETHYVDCRFQVTTAPPPQQYYLTVRTDPTGIGTIPGQGWYNAYTFVNLTAPEFFAGSTGTRYRFNYWDVDGTSQGTGVRLISVYMDAAHTATAHYVTQYFLNLTTNPLGVTTPAGVGWYDAGINVPIFAPEFISIEPGASRYRFNGWTTGDMSEIANPSATSTTVFLDKPKTVTANYVTQYYLTVISDYGTPTGEGWYDNGDTAYAGLDTDIVNHGNGTRRVFTSWGGDASGTNYAQSNPIVMNAAKTAIANWKTQYAVTFTQTGSSVAPTVTYTADVDPTDTVPFTVWVKAGSQITYTYQDIVPGALGVRYVLTSVAPSSPQTVTGPLTICGTYQTQYYLTVNTNPAEVLTLNPAAVSGQGWYNSGFTATVDAVQNVDKVAGESRYDFRSWTGATPTGVGNQATVLMDGPKTATANYQLQYKIIFAQSGVGSDFAGTVVIIDTTNYGRDSVFFWWDSGSSHSFAFQSPLIVTVNGKQYVWTSTTGLSTLQAGSINVSTSGSVTGNYKTRYYLTVTSPYGVPGGQGWYDSGSTAYATLDTGIFDHGNGTRRVFKNWNGDASGTNYAQSNPIVMNGPKTAVAVWKTQYRLTVRTSGLGTKTTNVYNGTVILGTATDATPYVGWFDQNVAIQLNIDSPISGSPARYVFTQWTGDASGSGRPASVTMSLPKDVTANYKTQYQITVTASPSEALGGTFKVTYTQCGTTYSNVQKTTLWTDWADAGTTVTVSEPQDIINSKYKFDHYDPSQSVTMNDAKTITLFYRQISGLSVSISPTTAKIKVGESVTFSSTVSGGEPSYRYQWYVNGSAVSGATSPSWTFTPATKGLYIIYLNVTDNLGNSAKSNEASVTVAPRLVVSISPTEASITIGQSVTFTSTVSGGYPPYTYKWYVNDILQPLESGDSFTFKPTSSGIYYVYLKVTDSNNNTVQSETARVVVSAIPFGGYSVSLTRPAAKTPLICYTMLLAISSVMLILFKRKRK